MKKITISFFLITVAVYFTSCKPAGQVSVNTWECAKILPLGEPKETDNAPKKLMDDTGMSVDEKGPTASTDPAIRELLNQYPDICKTILLKGDNSASLLSKKSKRTGTWKVNKEANSVEITLKNQKVLQYKYSDNTQERFSIKESYPYGKFEVFYRKIK